MAISKRSWKNKGGDQAAWVHDWADHSGCRHRQQFKTRREAEAHRTEIESQLRTGAFRPEARKITVREIAAEYQLSIEERHRRGERMTTLYLKGSKARIRNYILAEGGQPKFSRAKKFEQGIGALKLIQLRRRQIEDFRDRLRNAGLSVSATRNVLVTLYSMMEFAISRDYLALNPVHKVKVHGSRDEGAKEIELPSKELVRALLAAADEDFRVSLMFAVVTGVRAGEQRALRWKHIEFTKRIVSIKTRVDVYGVEDGQGPKTASGVRTIPLGAVLTSELSAWRVRSRYDQDEELVFPNSMGRYSDHVNMLRYKYKPLFNKLARQRALDPSLPVPTYFTWHVLRHFAISCWLLSGVPIKVAQKRAGHKSSRTTLDTYGHLVPSEDDPAEIEKIYKGIL